MPSITSIELFLFILVAVTLLFGGMAVFKHLVLRLMLAFNGDLPLNLARFLDYTADVILLRKVGGGYVYIHRMLLEHFAAMVPNPHKRKRVAAQLPIDTDLTDPGSAR